MRWLGVVLVVLAVVGTGWISVGRAAETPGLEKGAREVVFTFDSWALRSYNGGIGIRYFVTDGLALRPGLDFGINDHSTHETLAGSSGYQTDSTDTDNNSVGFSVYLEKYFAGFQKIAPFVAVGVAYTYTSSDNTSIHHTYAESVSDQDYWSDCAHSRQHNIDVIGAFGIQWYFTDHICLGGQYNLAISHWWENSDRTEAIYRGSETEIRTIMSDDDGTSTSLDAAKLMVSIRF